MQLDLLRPNLPNGLMYDPTFLSPDEAKALVRFLHTLQWQDVKMHGVIAKRKVVHYGLDYEYNQRTLSPTSPAPEELRFLISRSATLLKVSPTELAEVLVSYYPPGAGIGWHRDAPMFEKLIGVSLGSYCELRMRKGIGRTAEKFHLTLAPGSAYILEGEARWQWQHHIPPVKEDRYSITMRTLRQDYSST